MCIRKHVHEMRKEHVNGNLDFSESPPLKLPGLSARGRTQPTRQKPGRVLSASRANGAKGLQCEASARPRPVRSSPALARACLAHSCELIHYNNGCACVTVLQCIFLVYLMCSRSLFIGLILGCVCALMCVWMGG